MFLSFYQRSRRLFRRTPQPTIYNLLELTLLAVLAAQCARLFWTILTPVGPLGEWRAAAALRPVIRTSSELLGSFDPFFRTVGASGPAVVTSLSLKLFGVREDRASGRGSAIIGTPDGQQKSFVVGQEIAPGVTLMSVAFDYVTISRNGAAEQIYMDQSTPAPAASSAPPSVSSNALATAPASGAFSAAPLPPVRPVGHSSRPVQ